MIVCSGVGCFDLVIAVAFGLLVAVGWTVTQLALRDKLEPMQAVKLWWLSIFFIGLCFALWWLLERS